MVNCFPHDSSIRVPLLALVVGEEDLGKPLTVVVTWLTAYGIAMVEATRLVSLLLMQILFHLLRFRVHNEWRREKRVGGVLGGGTEILLKVNASLSSALTNSP